MSRRRGSPALAGTLDPPDAGFMAAAGAYVAAVLVAISIVLAVGMGASTATIVGSLSTAITVGLVAGGVAAGRVRGLPERLGRNVRGIALPFSVPALFVSTALLALATPSISTAFALSGGLGAAITFPAAGVIASMARTRYAKAMTPGEPIATVPLLNRTRNLSTIGWGIVSLAFAVVSARNGLNQFVLVFAAIGLFALWYGLSLRATVRGDGEDDGLFEWLEYDPFFETVDAELLPTIEIHGSGLVVKRPAQRRFVPWERIEDVRLTDAELRIERPGRRDIRCARAVIDDPERVLEEIERARSGFERPRAIEAVA
ncbi:MAG: PH domain-containing protein [Halalkalicoccus sp.]